MSVYPKLKKFLKKNASGHQFIFPIKCNDVDTKLNVYYFEKLHLQAYVWILDLLFFLNKPE